MMRIRIADICARNNQALHIFMKSQCSGEGRVKIKPAAAAAII
jgi:hypothetical protein